jgi:hypothetical protein
MSLDNDLKQAEPTKQSADLKNKSKAKPLATSVDDGLNHGKFTDEEEALFLSGLELHGRDWKATAKHMKTRDGNSVRYHVSLIKKIKSAAPFHQTAKRRKTAA